VTASPGQEHWRGGARAESFAAAAAWSHHTTTTHDLEMFGRLPRFGYLRFVDGKLAERWAQVDFEDIRRQLTGPIQ
jgi:hypothetical protein